MPQVQKLIDDRGGATLGGRLPVAAAAARNPADGEDGPRIGSGL
jgi:hypothetical protein